MRVKGHASIPAEAVAGQVWCIDPRNAGGEIEQGRMPADWRTDLAAPRTDPDDLGSCRTTNSRRPTRSDSALCGNSGESSCRGRLPGVTALPGPAHTGMVALRGTNGREPLLPGQRKVSRRQP